MSRDYRRGERELIVFRGRGDFGSFCKSLKITSLPTQEERLALLNKSLALKKRFESIELIRSTAMSRLAEITPGGTVILR